MKLLTSLFLSLFFLANAYAQDLKVVASEFPPFQFISSETNNVEGFTTEIVREVIERAGLRGTIKIYPWPRAYKIAQNEPNVLIYSIVKNPDREKLFKWIGVLAPFNVYFWKLRQRKDINIKKLDDAKKYIVGGMISDIKSAYLIKEGFVEGKNLVLSNSDALNVRMLEAKKIDLLTADEYNFSYRTKSIGYSPNLFSKMIKLNGISNELSLAASLGTSDEVVNKLRVALVAFQKTARFRQIQDNFK